MESNPETMVAESDSANIFKIGLLVFEILHNQHFSNAISSLILIKLLWGPFNTVNDKIFPEHEVEKIFQIGRAVQKL